MSLLRTPVLLTTALLLACGGKDPIVTLSLGAQTIGADGTVGPLVFDVPKNATSVVFWCEGHGEALGEVTQLVAPNGQIYLDASLDQTLPPAPVNAPPSLPRSAPTPELSTALVPSTPDLPIQSGEWEVTFATDATGTVDCGATVRTDAPTDEQVLDVEIVLVGVPGLTAEIAPNDPALQVAINGVQAMLAPHGLSMEVSYRDFSGDVAANSAPELRADNSLPLRDLVRQANPVDARAVTVFLVDRIVQADVNNQTVPGFIVGPVGAAGRDGTSRSGFVLTGATYRTDAGLLTNAFAHKLGHHLGLWHTTERDAALADPITDTPICGLEHDLNENGSVNAEECVDRGLDNAMWWSLARDPLSFSEAQGWVMRQSPLAQPVR